MCPRVIAASAIKLLCSNAVCWNSTRSGRATSPSCRGALISPWSRRRFGTSLRASMTMGELAWAGVIDHAWVPRSGRPRDKGVTMVIDTGVGLAATADMIEIAGPYIDHWKLGFGTSAAMPPDLLRRKLALLASHGLLTYPGGTLLEVAIVQHHCRVFMGRARDLGFQRGRNLRWHVAAAARAAAQRDSLRGGCGARRHHRSRQEGSSRRSRARENSRISPCRTSRGVRGGSSSRVGSQARASVSTTGTERSGTRC